MTPDTLSATLFAVADPTRRAILGRLRGGDASIQELAKPFALSLPAVTKHVRVLEQAGLIQKTRSAQWRPCTLRAERLQEVSAWLEPYRELWERRLDLLGEHLAAEAERGRNSEGESGRAGEREA